MSSSSSSSSGNYLASIFGGHSPDYETFDLDYRYLQEIKFFYKTVPTVKHCAETIDKFLFSDMRITGAKPVLQSYVTEYFVPFFRSCLRQILTVGWVLYRTVKTKDPRSGQTVVVPELIPLEYVKVQLRVNKKTFEHELLCYEVNGLEPIKNARFILYSDLQRLAQGSLIDSVLEPIMGDYRYVQQIKRFTMQAEYVRMNPTIFLRAAEGGSGEAASANKTGTMNRTSTVGIPENRSSVGLKARLTKKLPKQQEALEKASEEVSSNVEFHNEQIMSMNYKQSRSYYTLGLGLRPQYEDNVYICPPNMVLAAPPRLPESRVDQLVIERDLMTKIYQAFGIPETVAGFSGGSNVGSTGGASSKSAKVRTEINMMDIITFEATIDRFKAFFMDSFVLIYEEIFKKVLPKDAVQFYPPKLYELYIKNVVYSSVQGAEKPGQEQQQKQPTWSDRSAPSDESAPHESNGKSPGPKSKEMDSSHGKNSEQVIKEEEKLTKEAEKAEAAKKDANTKPTNVAETKSGDKSKDDKKSHKRKSTDDDTDRSSDEDDDDNKKKSSKKKPKKAKKN